MFITAFNVTGFVSFLLGLLMNSYVAKRDARQLGPSENKTTNCPAQFNRLVINLLMAPTWHVHRLDAGTCPYYSDGPAKGTKIY